MDQKTSLMHIAMAKYHGSRVKEFVFDGDWLLSIKMVSPNGETEFEVRPINVDYENLGLEMVVTKKVKKNDSEHGEEGDRGS